MPTKPTEPLSPAISQALTRCGVVNVGSWEVQLLAAVERARVARVRDETEGARGIVEVKAQLDSFFKALDRGAVPGAGAILKHWEGLEAAGRLFVEQELARLIPKVSGFDDLDLAVDAPKLRDATQRQLATKLDWALGKVNKIIKEARDNGNIEKRGCAITPKGRFQLHQVFPTLFPKPEGMEEYEIPF